METPEKPTSPVTPVAPMPFNLLHANPVSDNKQGQEHHQSNEYEHDGTNSSIQVMLETETESLPPQQLLELSPMQSDPDYEQYWEEHPLQHVQQCKDVEVQPMGAHSTAISVLNDSDEEIIPDSQEDVYLLISDLSLIPNPQFIWESAYALLKQMNDIYEMDQEKYSNLAQSGIKTVELATTNLPLWVHQINELAPKVSIAQGEGDCPAKH
ncbi:hypothetical protein ARMGADRAFT_1037217 [Armillaria gallica]|uniref:Uncharacterized protein n=1 Tax=Armillaria gallica TaxID=47427 RepID=A0A2H3CYM4_ARMGA|nr:hypothetical protein ARMGADRAFT_1037217 [Armillaria gallica]